MSATKNPKRGGNALKRKLRQSAGGGAAGTSYTRMYYAEIGRKGGTTTAARWRRVPVGAAAFMLVERATGKVGKVINRPPWLSDAIARKLAAAARDRQDF